MTAKEAILGRVREGLRRSPHSLVPSLPPVRLAPHSISDKERVAQFLAKGSALAANTFHADSAAEARKYVWDTLAGRTAVASNAPFLQEIGVTGLPSVQTGFRDREALRQTCSHIGCGITSADFALADTGTLVMLSSQEEARMISLLPPAHIAVVPASHLLSGLEELLTLVPKPALRTSSMVLITGPSRTGDIEQFLVRGVHGPGEVHLVVV